MTGEEDNRLCELVQSSPAGSKMEAAKEYGIDLTFDLRGVALTPTERILKMEAAVKFAESLHRAAAAPIDRTE